MIARRFLIYFILASVISVVTTVVFEIYALKHAAARLNEDRGLFAAGVGDFVGSRLQQEATRLKRVLSDLPKQLDAKGLKKVAPLLVELRKDSLDANGATLFDSERRVIMAHRSALGLPPQDLLLPALRRAEASGEAVLTDFWKASDGPWVALVVGNGAEGEAWRAALTQVRLDGPEFRRLFGFFGAVPETRLQLLDSRGVALFSTRDEEQGQSVVHGSYFSDRVRLGEAATMRCHSCHEAEGAAEPQHTEEILTVARVSGTEWTVTVREEGDHRFAPVKEVARSTIGLVAVILGLFLGFFILLFQRVLKPVRQLVGVASAVDRGESPPSAGGTAAFQDELGTLARSLRELGDRGPRGAGAAAPAELGEGEGLDGGAQALRQADELRRSLLVGLGEALDGIVRIRPVAAALLVIRRMHDMPAVVLVRGFTLERGELEDLAEPLLALGRGTGRVAPEELAALGLVPAAETGALKQMLVHGLGYPDWEEGQLWTGIAANSEVTERLLAPVLELIATQLRSLMLKTAFRYELGREHDQKNRVLSQLFEAEDEERRRIARRIHDETSQLLSALQLRLDSIPADSVSAASSEHLEVARSLVKELLEQTDRLIRRLRPALLDNLGLVEGIRATGERLLVESGIEFSLETEGDPSGLLDRTGELAVFRVFQEAMTNVLRHAEATRVEASLRVEDGSVRGWIQDDGKGMAPGQVRERDGRKRWGLIGMRERIEQLGGTVRIEDRRSEGRGTRIEFDLPAPEEVGASR